MLRYLILFCFNRIGEQRTVASIYHILTGRRSAQTIQDVHLYQLTNFYGATKSLTRVQFTNIIKELIAQNYLNERDQSLVVLTAQAKNYLVKEQDKYPIHYLQGLKYVDIMDGFIARFHLAVQTYSNLVMKNKTFRPISDDETVQHWVKQNFHQNRQELRYWLRGIHNELLSFLNALDNEMYAMLFVDRLSGYQQAGYSIQQLARIYQIEEPEIELILVLLFHKLLTFAETNQLSTVRTFVEDLNLRKNNRFLTKSAQITLRLLESDYTIAQIAQKRKLKRATIEDHIIELTYAYYPFRIHTFIDQSSLENITLTIAKLPNHKLSLIKQALHNNYSYFQIRLALVHFHNL
ncbi:Uncharacterized protein YpbB [Amphibacillus marinus]|uniref:Uncharacterized protein YpbB n=1 Tax=Amphibacillus marinus TaxID=872970 RepID=A0A1H8GD55_9BACI|nr:helix-turn-helix domain-containing protein [Amphibacillus marinus]SEN41913.1 Uncharacterized protein YpbB [Amphibacillus marinus]